MLITWMFTTLILLQILDAWTTYHVLKKGGYEKNKFLARVMSAIGVYWTLLIVKSAYVAGLIYVWMYFPRTEELTVALLISVAVYVGVVANNYKIYLDYEK